MKNWRSNLIFLVIFIFSAAVIGRLIYLQIIHGSRYKAWSQGMHGSLDETKAERGEIFLKSGQPLAINVDYPGVYAVPTEVENKEETAENLAGILGLEKDFVLDKLSKEGSYSSIKKKLTDEELEKIKNMKIKGIYPSRERGRYYPQESLASQVVGFLNEEGLGQYGLEEYYDNVLSGGEDFLENEKGQDLYLTIDYNIQFQAEKLLREYQKDLEFEKGQILVIEPSSGKIVAMAHYPVFDPNNYKDYAENNLEVFKNRLTLDLFEPGSVFKPITMAGALEEGKVTPKTTYIDQGVLKIDGYTIYNYGQRVYKEQTMTNVLEKSINTGAVFAQQQLGPNLFLKYIEKFGIFEKTGIDTKETISQNEEIKKGRDINYATAAFGQGIDLTPVQLVRAYCAIANGGKLIKPYLVENLYQKDEEPEVISSKTAHDLTSMMVSVVENGFGKPAKVPGYYIAGKTGTAQVSFSSLGITKRGYSEKTIQSFLGFAPAYNPKFLILVKVDNPKTATAEYSAIPVFHDLAEYIINYWQIPPDYE